MCKEPVRKENTKFVPNQCLHANMKAIHTDGRSTDLDGATSENMCVKVGMSGNSVASCPREGETNEATKEITNKTALASTRGGETRGVQDIERVYSSLQEQRCRASRVKMGGDSTIVHRTPSRQTRPRAVHGSRARRRCAPYACRTWGRETRAGRRGCT
ncbi:hypothetical protein B0H12DRAFT_96476 [Mycena haematopus]|nr:hypothetical protein B0H12DRAFT_96476 [Mycena haematopus]